MMLATKYPNLVKSAVLSNAPVTIDTKFRMIADVQLSGMKRKTPLKDLIEAILPWCYSSKFLDQPNVIEILIEAMVANPFPISITGYKSQLNALDNFDAKKIWHDINSPCFVIGADQDLIVNKADTEQLVATIANSEYYCFKNCGHLPHIEQPELFIELAKRFVCSDIREYDIQKRKEIGRMFEGTFVY